MKLNSDELEQKFPGMNNIEEVHGYFSEVLKFCRGFKKMNFIYYPLI